MKKKIIIALFVVIVLGAIVYVSSKKKGNVVTDILSLNPNNGIICTHTSTVGENGNSVTTTIYIFGNKMRYDSFLTAKEQGQKDIHLINDGEYSYMWGEGIIANTLSGGLGSNGMKMKNSDNPEEYNSFISDIDIKKLKEASFNIPGLDCKPWDGDRTIFDLPKDVNFVDMKEMMNPVNFSGSVNNSDIDFNSPSSTNYCDICEMIPDTDDKKECMDSCSM
jgi:hypothetical protein